MCMVIATTATDTMRCRCCGGATGSSIFRVMRAARAGVAMVRCGLRHRHCVVGDLRMIIAVVRVIIIGSLGCVALMMARMIRGRGVHTAVSIASR